jgi:hypothetical protein
MVHQIQEPSNDFVEVTAEMMKADPYAIIGYYRNSGDKIVPKLMKDRTIIGLIQVAALRREGELFVISLSDSGATVRFPDMKCHLKNAHMVQEFVARNEVYSSISRGVWQ